MDYTKLALEFMEKMHLLRKTKPQKKLDESMRGEIFVLEYISMRGKDVLPSGISNEIDISSARIAATLNSLEKKGFITREIDKSDRRRILVNLTPEGKKIAESHKQELLSNVIRMLSGLGEEDANEYVRITGKMAELVRKCPEIER